MLWWGLDQLTAWLPLSAKGKWSVVVYTVGVNVYLVVYHLYMVLMCIHYPAVIRVKHPIMDTRLPC